MTATCGGRADDRRWRRSPQAGRPTGRRRVRSAASPDGAASRVRRRSACFTLPRDPPKTKEDKDHTMAKRLVPLLLATLVSVGAVQVLAPSAARATGCWQNTCTGRDPMAMGCTDGQTVQEFSEVREFHVELRYSAACGALWTRVTNNWYANGNSQNLIAQVISYRTMAATAGERIGRYSIQALYGVHYTDMVSLQNPAKACDTGWFEGPPDACTAPSSIVSVTQGSNPIGTVDSAVRIPGGVRVTGWSLDPDVAAPVAVHIYGGNGEANPRNPAVATTANTARPDVGAAYPGYGNSHGFSVFFATGTSSAQQTFCAYGINADGTRGGNARLACAAA
jgi:Protein of unknown function (DUF2690)